MRYRGKTGEKPFFFKVEPPLFAINQVGIVWLGEPRHYSECIFIHFLLHLFLLHLHPGLPSELVLSHMVEIRGLDGTLVHTPKHLVLSFLIRLH